MKRHRKEGFRHSRMLFLICLFAASATANLLEEELEFAFDGMKNCDDFTNKKIWMKDLVLEQIGRNEMAVSGNLIIDTPITEEFIVKAFLSKCPSKTERGLCENMPPETITDLCQKIKDKDSDWYPFIEKLENFKNECDIQPGKYPFQDYAAKLDEMASMPQIKGYYTLNLEGFIHEEKIMCVIMEFSFEPVGKKSKKHKSG